jgi:C4-dicarboxylate-specific signal transduction histidine kinase
MGGSLSAANATPRGARFTLLLPMVAASTKERAA